MVNEESLKQHKNSQIPAQCGKSINTNTVFGMVILIIFRHNEEVTRIKISYIHIELLNIYKISSDLRETISLFCKESLSLYIIKYQ